MTDHDEKKSGGGPIGEQVVRNVEELRKIRGLSLRALSAALGELGRPIGYNQLHALSQGSRRIDADDLIALALALEVTPASLLFPRDIDWDDVVDLTPEVRHRAYDVWRWAQSLAPLPPDLSPTGSSEREDATPADRASDFAKNALPRGGDVKFDPALRANFDLGGWIQIALRDFGNPDSWNWRRDKIIRGRQLLDLQIDDLIARGDREAAAREAGDDGRL